MRSRIVVPIVALAAGLALGAGALASGQPASSSKARAAAATKEKALFAVLTGRKEVSPTGERGAGDLDGRGSFSATVDGEQLCFGVTVKNIDAPIAMHIHKGRRNVAGSVVVPLEPIPESGDPGASSGCVDIATDLATAILKNPHKYYVNVHTAPFAGGAVRGQLFTKSR
jgi:hypothetical protein